MSNWLKGILQHTNESGKRFTIQLLKIKFGKPKRKSEPVVGKKLTGLDEKK